MDLASFLTGLLPMLAVGCVGVVAFRRRRRRPSPLIVNPYTLAVEENGDALGSPPVVSPGPATTSSRRVQPRSTGKSA